MKKLYAYIAGALTALALASAALAQSVTYPVTNPTYIPTAIMNPSPTYTAAGESAVFNVSGVNTVTVRLALSAGSMTGNIQGTNSVLGGSPVWTNLQMVPIGGGAIVTSFSAAGFWSVNTAGLTGVRVHFATLSGGTATVSMAGSMAPNGTTILNPSAAASGTILIDQTTPGTTNGVALVGVNGATALAGNGTTGTGSPRVTIASDNTPFPIKIDQTTPGTTNAVVGTLTATGGSSLAHVISTASTNAGLIGSAAAHSLYSIYAVNTNAAAAYLKFYNKATSPTCNSDTVLYTVPLVQNVPASVSFGPAGAAFALGIGVCITGAQADNDNTNATTGITVSASYK